jgi:hypothetical protein
MGSAFAETPGRAPSTPVSRRVAVVDREVPKRLVLGASGGDGQVALTAGRASFPMLSTGVPPSLIQSAWRRRWTSSRTTGANVCAFLLDGFVERQRASGCSGRLPLSRVLAGGAVVVARGFFSHGVDRFKASLRPRGGCASGGRPAHRPL